MNTNASIRRRVAAAAVAAIVVPTFAACGDEVSPPAQDIGGASTEKKESAPRAPKRTTGNRYDFGDEYGKARPRTEAHEPAGSGTRNRMDFGDTGR